MQYILLYAMTQNGRRTNVQNELGLGVVLGLGLGLGVKGR